MKNIVNFLKNYYTPGFPGIIKNTGLLENLITLLDKPAVTHLKENYIEFRQFTFDWFICLFLREFPNDCSIRYTFILTIRILAYFTALEEEVEQFLVFMAAAYFMKFSKKVKSLKAEEIRFLF